MQQDNMNNNQRKSNSLAWLFLIIIGVYLVLMLVNTILNTKGLSMPTYLALIVSEALILVPGIVYVLVNKLDLRKDLGFRKIKVGTIFLSILLAFLTTPVASFVNVLTQFFVSNTMTQASDALLDGSYLALLFLTGFYGPFCEEVVFRGILHEGYDRISSPMKAVLISALLFGLMHLNVNQTCYAFVLGVIFAIVNKASGSVYTSMIIHTCINTVNILMLIVAQWAASFVGEGASVAESAEAMRQSTSTLMVIAGVYFVLALGGIAISIPVVIFIAKHEGHLDELKSLFIKKKIEQEPSENTKVLMNVPMIISVVLCLVLIFALDAILAALGLA